MLEGRNPEISTENRHPDIELAGSDIFRDLTGTKFHVSSNKWNEWKEAPKEGHTSNPIEGIDPPAASLHIVCAIDSIEASNSSSRADPECERATHARGREEKFFAATEESVRRCESFVGFESIVSVEGAVLSSPSNFA